MKTLVELYKEYLQNTSPEQVAKDWEYAKSKGNYGPTVNEFINNLMEQKNESTKDSAKFVFIKKEGFFEIKIIFEKSGDSYHTMLSDAEAEAASKALINHYGIPPSVLLDYEIRASWWASWISIDWMQNLVVRYYVRKVIRKHYRYKRSICLIQTISKMSR